MVMDEPVPKYRFEVKTIFVDFQLSSWSRFLVCSSLRFIVTSPEFSMDLELIVGTWFLKRGFRFISIGRFSRSVFFILFSKPLEHRFKEFPVIEFFHPVEKRKGRTTEGLMSTLPTTRSSVDPDTSLKLFPSCTTLPP